MRQSGRYHCFAKESIPRSIGTLIGIEEIGRWQLFDGPKLEVRTCALLPDSAEGHASFIALLLYDQTSLFSGIGFAVCNL
jgi:hypothetical protein